MVSARRHPATPNSDILDAVLRGLASCRGPDSSGWYTALCPFHTDQRHPNLRVNERGFRCMACGRKGPLHDLAERLGIGVERHEAKEIASAYDYQDAEGKLLSR